MKLLLKNLQKIKAKKLEITVFISGAVVMVFELVGSRILAPYFGNSIFIWTSIIGIILGSLSLGYYFGGKFADKNPNPNHLYSIIFLAAISIVLTTAIKEPFLLFLQEHTSEIRIGTVLSSIFLFFPTSFFLGMVSPFAARLKLKKISSSGSTVGNLYALSTVGSITGTFLSGFYLIPLLGTNKLLLLLSLTLLLLSLFFSASKKNLKILSLILLALLWLALTKLNNLLQQNGFVDIDTPYSRVWIYDYKNSSTDKLARTMQMDMTNQSTMFLESDKLANKYTNFYDLAKHFNPNLESSLMIGGGGYSYPKYYLSKYPNSTIDVVEIDKDITSLAEKYFKLEKNPRLNIYHQDGRVFLNQTNKKYDAILIDAFSSLTPPFQLATLESVQKQHQALNQKGVVVLNIVSSLSGEKSKLLQAQLKTYQAVFPQVYVFSVYPNSSKTKANNKIILALKSSEKPSFKSQDPFINQMLQTLETKKIPTNLPILTDDRSPTGYYTLPIIKDLNYKSKVLVQKLKEISSLFL